MRRRRRMPSARVVVTAAIRLDEAHDATLVEVIQLVDRVHAVSAMHRSSPGTARAPRDPDTARRRRGAPPGRGPRTGVGSDHNAPVLEVVDVQLPRDRPRVDSPGGDVGQVRAGRGRIGVVRHVRVFRRRDVRVAEARDELPGARPRARAYSQPPVPATTTRASAVAAHTSRRRWRRVSARREPGGAPGGRLPPRLAEPFCPFAIPSPPLRSPRPAPDWPRARPADGGSAWESNPPRACLEPDTGFEVREAHRDPMRFRARKIASLSVSPPLGQDPGAHPARARAGLRDAYTRAA